jgi:poly-gamma-glutamate capsule biosynthesis protein CapA/YwtB (metallophosphatase superfamily)/MFS family permease
LHSVLAVCLIRSWRPILFSKALVQEPDNRLHVFIAVVLLALAFLHGVFSSGFVSILNLALGPQAPLAFSLYFVGLLLGQLGIYLFAGLNARHWNYPLYEIGFGASLVFMALMNNTEGFIIGRLLEGIMGGLATPPLFNYLVTLKAFGHVGKRIALFNSIFVLGYVLGPVIMDGLRLLMPYPRLLFLSGIVFGVVSLFLMLMPVPDPPPPDLDISLKKLLRSYDWFEKFSTLVLAKGLYGYLISFTAGYITQFLPGFPLAQVMLGFSVVFVCGQILTGRVLRYFPKSHLEVYLPLLLCVLLGAFLGTHWAGFIFILALFHSSLVFIGTLNFGLKATSAREYALFSCLSDPAMILGAGLASFGLNGVWGIVLLLLVPGVRALFLPPQRTRAEAFIPWIGPLTLVNIFRKQKSPLLEPANDAAPCSDLQLSYCAPNGPNPETETTTEPQTEPTRLKLLLSGDLCPPPHSAQTPLFGWHPELRRLIENHDLAALNLESPLELDQKAKASEHLHALSLQQFEALAGSDQALFGLINLANNHSLDQGLRGFEQTRQYLQAKPGFYPLDSRLQIIERAGLRLGFFALSFGSNCFWRKHPDLSLLKPEELLHSQPLQKRLFEQIQAYRQEVDLLVLSWHWGYESEQYPSQTLQAAFHWLADAGVDLLWGHHSHLVQPFELSQDALCLYSCGNLLSNLEGEGYHQGVLWSVTLQKSPDGLRIQTVKPHFFRADQNHLLSPLEQGQSLLEHSFREHLNAPTR